MAETTALTDVQLRAVALMAEGLSQNEAAKRLGCNRVTINRWAQKPDFAAALAAEIERRRLRTEQQLQEAADRQIDENVASIRDELAEYHKAVVNVQKQRLTRGRLMMEKAIRRLQDLPDEALTAADAVRMAQAADSFLEKGLGNWGEALAIDDLMSRLGNAE